MNPPRRLQILCLEGLSASAAEKLVGRLPSLEIFLQQGRIEPLIHSPISSFQPVWAEILWGKSWPELAVPGYASPRDSLNCVELIQENALPMPCRLLSNSSKCIVVNVPLLTPNPNRLWLSDGSFPGAVAVSPVEAAEKLSLNKYSPRPFACASVGTARLSESISQCLKVESVRLDCAARLLRGSEWTLSIVRLTVFDLLSHLLGPDFLEETDRIGYGEIDQFLSVLDSWFADLMDLFPDDYLCVLSALGHAPCQARVNLNQLLRMGGYCKLLKDEQSEQSVALARRKAAAMQVLRDEDVKELAVTPAWSFDLPATLCGSAVQGAIYLNLKSRYSGGIVDNEEARGILSEVRGFIEQSLKQQLGLEPEIWQCDAIGAVGPELMIYAPGVEFHNSVVSEPIDKMNRPRSCHTSEGFVWLPANVHRVAGALTPVALHDVLWGLCR